MNEFIGKLIEKLMKDKRIGRTSFAAVVEDINQLAEEYAKTPTPTHPIPIDTQQYIAELEAKVKEKDWIPCSEKYPEDNQTVLAIDSEGNMEVLDYDTNWENSFCKYGGTVRVFNIIAWMPLPEPYKKEGAK